MRKIEDYRGGRLLTKRVQSTITVWDDIDFISLRREKSPQNPL
jgi:hypothetical protein